MPDDIDLDDAMDAVRQGRVRVTGRTQAIALLLHGGRATELQPKRFRDGILLHSDAPPLDGGQSRAGRDRSRRDLASEC